MKTSIYNEYEALTREAQEFEAELHKILAPVFEAAQERFLARDIAQMVIDVAYELTAVTVLGNAIAARRAQNYCPDCTHRWIEHRQTLLAHPHSHRCEHQTEGDDMVCGCNTVKPNA